MFTTHRPQRRCLVGSVPALGIEWLESRVLLAATELSNGTGPGAVSVVVDSYGSYQNALYQPVGTTERHDTAFYSGVYVSLVDKFLDEVSMPELAFSSTAASTATSTFNSNGLAFALTQTLGAPDTNGGTDLVQQYQITNTTGAPVSLTLVRHLDGDLRFAGGFSDDQAGVSADGRSLFEFDDASDPASASGLLSITNSGGDHAGYAIQPYSYSASIVAAHGIPANDLNKISGDADNNRLTDAGYDVTLSLQNNLTIAAGATQTFTTTTRFGQGAPNDVISQPGAIPPPQQDTGFTPISLDFAAEAVGSQSDGRLIMAGHRPAGAVIHGVIQRFNADGTADSTFGNNGVVESATDANEAFYSLAVQPDDKLVVSGRSGSDFIIARYNADGSPDSTFGTSGRTLTNFGGTEAATAFAVALGPGGTIVLGGGANGAFAFARYTSTGAPDPTFGNGGTVTYDVGTTNDAIAALAVQSDGSIIVAGAGDIGGASVLVTRLTPAGAPDLTFGGGNVIVRVPGLAALTDLGTADATEGLAVQPDNRILIANRTPDGNFGLVRLMPDGAPDPAFGTGGLAVADFGGEDDADSVLLKGAVEGQIMVVGTTATGPTGAIAIAAFNPDGTPVASFGSGGKVVQDTGLGNTRTFRSGGTVRKSLSSVQTRTNRLITGASDQSATEARSSFSRLIVPGSITETVVGTFGAVAGQRKPAQFVVPGTTVKLSLKGGGSGQVVTDTAKPGQVKLVLTGTTAKSVLSVKGKQRLALSDVAADGPMGKVSAKTGDLAGTLFVNGPVANITLGNVAGSASAPATIAASGAIRSLSVLSLSNARVLSGANLGADALVGGGDDTFGAGQIHILKVAGAVAASFVGAGVNAVNGIFGDAGDTLVGGAASSIDKVTAKGGVDTATLFEAGSFGRIRKLGREKVDPTTDARFRVLA